MKKLLLSLTLMLVAILAQAQETLALTSTQFANGTSTYTYHGTTTSGGWYGKLTTSTTPVVTIESTDESANNIGWSSSRPWLKAGYTYNITMEEGYKVTSYSLTTQSTSSGYSNTYTYTTADGTATSEAQVVNTNKTISAEGLYTDAIQLVINGSAGSSNYGILIITLSITYEVEGEATTITYTLTDAAGNIFTGEYEGVAGIEEPAFEGVSGYTLSNSVWDGANFTADIDFNLPVSKEGGVTNATMISSFKSGYNYYLEGFKWYTTDGTSINVTRSSLPDIANIDNYLWAIYPSLTDETFVFTIKNIATDKYIYTEADYTSGSGAHGSSVIYLQDTPKQFSFNGSTGQFYYLSANSVTQYISLNSTSTEGEQPLGVYAKSHNGTTNCFPATSYTVTISTAGAATLYTAWEVEIPEGVEAKYPVAAGEGVLTYEILDGVIPANSAVVLIGEAATYTFAASDTDTEAVQGNLLFGYSESTAADATKIGAEGTIYALGKIDDVVAFYHFTGDTHAAGKAYLEIPEATQIRSFSIFDNAGGTTSISSIDCDKEQGEDVIYDLCGRRVKTMQRGIYIVNGKKVIIK